MDGRLIEAWASIKIFRPIDEEPPGEDDAGDRNRPRDFHGARWSNAAHRSTTDADSRLYRKGRGKEAKLSYMDHALMEHQNGLIVHGLAGEVMLIRPDDAKRFRQNYGDKSGYRLRMGFPNIDECYNSPDLSWANIQALHQQPRCNAISTAATFSDKPSRRPGRTASTRSLRAFNCRFYKS